LHYIYMCVCGFQYLFQISQPLQSFPFPGI
jgi:hypothetical protein